MDGRILKEALLNQQGPKATPRQKTIVVSHSGKQSKWSQYLKVESIGSEDYLDEGNGESIPRAAKAQR
jgi:hypothetical protein